MTALPIDAVLPELLAAVRGQNMAVLQAPPGAGKTTRVPLALLGAGLFDGKIIMLEPRRLAARAAAERLADQRGQQVGVDVGYAMRGANTTSKTTRIDVVTEGVLTRMIQTDPELSGISAILFDEFHERSLQADLGLALCLEIRNALRPDLCLIAMSATLDAGPVANLMGAPVVTSKGRSFPVDIKYLDRPWRTPNSRGRGFEPAMADLIETACLNTTGSVLAFLPGEGEIRRVQTLLSGRNLNGADIRPLFGAMPFADQRRAIAPSKTRKLVLATSIAETSLTIEDIRVVVDGGLARRAQFDAGRGMQSLVTDRVTKAEATQRAGRAGRVAAGTCYKLWTEGENGGLAPFPLPEIQSSDLTGLVLELAAWGCADPVDLPFLTPPRATDFAAAQDLLIELGALDANRAITAQGRAIAKMPTHPRLGAMLLGAGPPAATLAALIEGRDILQSQGRDTPADLTLRMAALNDPNKFERDEPYRANRAAIPAIKDTAKRLRASGKSGLSLGQMAALAFPDRVAQRREGKAHRFLMSGGTGAELGASDALGNHRMLVITELDGRGPDARVRTAIPITMSELTDLFPDRIETIHSCAWSKRDRTVIARSQDCFGALALTSQIWRDCPPEDYATALLDGILELGAACLPWTKPASLLRGRIEWLRAAGADLPDCSDTGLLESASQWLLPALIGIKTIDGLKALDLTAQIKNRLNWDQQQMLDAQAPAAITAPTGTKLSIDYSGDAPKVSVRLQELFGLNRHPTVGPNRLPVLIEMLSPAQRPVQMTADLPNFWRTSYADVRKDMRGRYPRHPWPENPANAEPTRRVKPRGT